ncbi:MAG: exodeoxyribonuclease VII large subunit [Candidatus Omnitrophica bacterium]|nr:exodeoxyribonuclease VII large subunit [Candidatus Omnitrophota bacterium]
MNVYTVTEITREIKGMLEETYSGIWVEGEVSNLSKPASGHIYFSIKDEFSSLKCVIFKSYSKNVKFDVEDGMKVLCFGNIGIYEKSGQYQMYVDMVEPKGKGALHIAFEQLKEKLYKEGLFDESIKKDIPDFPKRIGVVTSSTGAAIKDIIEVSQRRYPNIEITIFPVQVQGDNAKTEIAEAIYDMNIFNEKIKISGEKENPIDLMIVGRGGGSVEDLWAFNEEVVARAIHDSDIPVISAVGHEIDFTISDLVADIRAATPSQAAEIAVPIIEDIKDRIDDVFTSLERSADIFLENKFEKIVSLEKRLNLMEPVNALLQLEQKLDETTQKLSTYITQYISQEENGINYIQEKLNILNPVNVLKRGYSITFKDGKIINNAASLKKGDEIVSKFAEGEVGSVVG